ncbi:MAG: META domain-containing protein [Treponema sp.]|nr:META domain-containing protein [Treponema sp.]
MKKQIITVLMILLANILIFSCVGVASTGSEAAAETEFVSIEGIEWLLSQIIRSGRSIQIDRESIGMGEIYTISFLDGRVSGIGAPNRFFGPFYPGEGYSLSIETLASTLMAAIFEPEVLKEHEYFAYLMNVTGWSLREGNLELYSSGADGNEVSLVFTPK